MLYLGLCVQESWTIKLSQTLLWQYRQASPYLPRVQVKQDSERKEKSVSVLEMQASTLTCLWSSFPWPSSRDLRSIDCKLPVWADLQASVGWSQIEYSISPGRTEVSWPLLHSDLYFPWKWLMWNWKVHTGVRNIVQGEVEILGPQLSPWTGLCGQKNLNTKGWALGASLVGKTKPLWPTQRVGMHFPQLISGTLYI